jgi:hypothetical protein
MKLKNLIILGLLLSTGMLNAQTDFRPGYIIKETGDTIFGDIDYRGDLLMGSICRFRVNESEITNYYPNDISAFRFIDSKYYVSREINNKKVFMEYLIKGEVNIYYLRDETGDHYYIDKEDVRLTEIPYEKSIRIVDDKEMLYESTLHMGFLKYYMKEAPELESKIQSIRKPDHRNLIKLAEDYHYAVCDSEECLIYEKKLPFLKVSISPFLGWTKYKGPDKLVPEFGGYLYLWAPRTSEKVFFKTGLAYNRLTVDGEVSNIYKIPVHIQYIYRAHWIQPEVSGGFNFFTTQYEEYGEVGHTLSLNAGLNFQILPKASISTLFNSDYTPIGLSVLDENKEFDIISYSIILGLRIDF